MANRGMLPTFISMDLGAGTSSHGVLLTAIGVGAVTASLAVARLSVSGTARHSSRFR
jgi:Transmembrane secretion effector